MGAKGLNVVLHAGFLAHFLLFFFITFLFPAKAKRPRTAFGWNRKEKKKRAILRKEKSQ